MVLNDMLGNELMRKEISVTGEMKNEMDLSNYSAGTYILHIESAEGSSIHKIVKQ